MYTGTGGETYRTQVRLPLYIEELFPAMQREFPEYGTISDLIRDALVHRIHTLRTSDDPELERLREQYRRWAGVESERSRQIAMQEIYRSCQETWQNAESEDQVERARQSIAEVIENMRDPDWRRRFELIIRK